MRWFFAFPFILLGAFLFALTIDDIGIVGNTIKIIIGVGCFYIAGFIVRNKNKKNNHLKLTRQFSLRRDSKLEQ